MVVTAQVAVVTLWAASRTLGLPVGPGAWTPEAVGTADPLAVGLELVCVVAVLAAARAGVSPQTRTVRSGRYLAAVGGGALLVATLTTPALASTGAGEHARPHGSHGHDADGHVRGHGH